MTPRERAEEAARQLDAIPVSHATPIDARLAYAHAQAAVATALALTAPAAPVRIEREHAPTPDGPGRAS